MRKAADAEVAALKQQVAQVAPLEARLKDLEAIVKAYGYTTIARGVLLFLNRIFLELLNQNLCILFNVC